MNRILDPFSRLMDAFRENMAKEGLTFGEMMSYRKLLAAEKELLGELVEAGDDGMLSRQHTPRLLD